MNVCDWIRRALAAGLRWLLALIEPPCPKPRHQHVDEKKFREEMQKVLDSLDDITPSRFVGRVPGRRDERFLN